MRTLSDLSGEQTALANVFTAFLQNAQIRGFSKKTIELYRWVYLQIPEDLKMTPIAQLQSSQLRPLFIKLLELNWKPTSISIIYRSLHAVFSWSIREGLLDDHPLKNIPAPKVPKVFPFTLEDHEIQALLRASASLNSKAGVRNQLILMLFLDCGIRLNELISLKLSDINLVNRTIKVYGKGAKERFVFLSAKTIKAIRRWLDVRGHSYSDLLFTQRFQDPLPARRVQNIITDLGRQAGLKSALSPHRLRHVSATLAVRNGMDPFTLQRLYGWEDVKTAMRYVNASPNALREAHAKFSPLDRF